MRAPRVFKFLNCLFHALEHDRRGARRALFDVAARHADHHTFHVFAQRASVIDDRRAARSRILRIVPGDRIEHMCQVFDHARHGPAVIQRPAQRRQPVAAHASVSRLQPRHAAKRRRIANRPGRILAERAETEPPATAAPDPVLEPPVICSVFHGLRGTGRSASGKLLICSLPIITAPGFTQLAHRRGIADAFGELPNARRRALDVQLIFHRNGMPCIGPRQLPF
jgi:hypothetical protein